MTARKTTTTAKVTAWRELVCFDFDGVLSEGRGYHWPLTGLDTSLITEAHERGYAAAIMTCNDVELVTRELRQHKINAIADPDMTHLNWTGGKTGCQVLVTGRKLAAKFYVDDRNINHQYGQDPQQVWDQADRLAGFHPCPTGHRHWGPLGAAGVLPWAVVNHRTYVLLGQRSKWVQSPGTWSGFGGAIEPGEQSGQAAGRELAEELRGCGTAELGPGIVTACPLGCGWTYTTHLARVGPGEHGLLPTVRIADGETSEIRWVPVADVAGLGNLHPGLAATWESLRAELEEVPS